jgi:hypothetical protein
MATQTITVGAGGPTINGITTGRHPVKLTRVLANTAIRAEGAGEQFTIALADTITIDGEAYVPADIAALEAKLRDEVFFLAEGGGGITEEDLEAAIADQQPVYLHALQALGSAIKGQSVGVDMSTLTQNLGVNDEIMYWMAVWLPKAGTITGVKFHMHTTGSFTGNNTNGLALYSYSGGTLTKVAETANDANIWKNTAMTIVSVPFATPYAAAAGLHFVAYCYNASTATTAPQIGGGANIFSGINNGDFTNSGKLFGYTLSTSFPSTQAISGLTVQISRPWFGLY